MLPPHSLPIRIDQQHPVRVIVFGKDKVCEPQVTMNRTLLIEIIDQHPDCLLPRSKLGERSGHPRLDDINLLHRKRKPSTG